MNLEGIMFREKVRNKGNIAYCHLYVEWHIVIYMWNLKQKNEYSKKKKKKERKKNADRCTQNITDWIFM